MAAGKRAGARPPRRFRPDLLVLALGVTVALVAWGYLVVAAIGFGGDARGGDASSWWLLALAALGAMACLFLALVLGARAARALGLTREERPYAAADPTAGATQEQSGGGDTGLDEDRRPRPPPGGRRAAR